MPTTPATQTVYSFVSTGAATYTLIPQWIFQQADIRVYINGTLLDDTTYSVDAITSGDTASYSITFTTPPIVGATIAIVRDIEISEPDNFAPGAPLTAADLNNKFDVNFILDNDLQYYSDNITPKYNIPSLVEGDLTSKDLVLPQLSTPGAGETPRVWAKDETGDIIDAPLDPGGKTAAELETELAENADATGSGATMIGYFDTQTTTPSNVQTVLDTKAKYTGPTGKIVSGNGLTSDDSSAAATWVYTLPASGGYDRNIVLGKENLNFATYIQSKAVEVRTDIPGGAFSWAEGSPSPTVPATSFSDTTLATRGWVAENTIAVVDTGGTKRISRGCVHRVYGHTEGGGGAGGVISVTNTATVNTWTDGIIPNTADPAKVKAVVITNWYITVPPVGAMPLATCEAAMMQTTPGGVLTYTLTVEAVTLADPYPANQIDMLIIFDYFE